MEKIVFEFLGYKVVAWGVWFELYHNNNFVCAYTDENNAIDDIPFMKEYF